MAAKTFKAFRLETALADRLEAVADATGRRQTELLTVGLISFLEREVVRAGVGTRLDPGYSMFGRPTRPPYMSDGLRDDDLRVLYESLWAEETFAMAPRLAGRLCAMFSDELRRRHDPSSPLRRPFPLTVPVQQWTLPQLFQALIMLGELEDLGLGEAGQGFLKALKILVNRELKARGAFDHDKDEMDREREQSD